MSALGLKQETSISQMVNREFVNHI